jgi:branched-chain amino acid transport system substrate-binding protein
MKISQRTAGVVAIAAVAVLGLSACSGGSGTGSDGQEFDGELTVGVLLPLTGGQSLLATQMQDATEDLVAQVNADGGIGGAELVIRVYDDKGSPDEAAKLAQRAISVDGVVALAGSQGSASSLAVKEVAERNEVVYVAPAVASPLFTEENAFSFRFNPTSGDLGKVPSGVATALGLASVSVLYDSGAVGQSLSDNFIANLEEAGIELAGPAISYPLDGTDMSSAVASIKAQSPDGIVIGGSSGADSGLILKTLVEQGIELPVIGIGQLGYPDSISVGGSAYDDLSTYFNNNVDGEKAEYAEFAEAFEEAHGAAPQEAVAQMHDAVLTLINGLTETEGEGGKALAEAIEGLDPFVGVAAREGYDIDFGADDHDAWEGAFLAIYEVRDGALVKSDIQLD